MVRFLLEFKLASDSQLSPSIATAINSSRQIHSDTSLLEFTSNCLSHAHKITSTVHSQLDLYPTAPLYSFGSSARGNTVLTYLGLNTLMTSLVDSSSLKWGKISANTGLEVISIESLPSDTGFILYVAAWNFKDEILQLLAQKKLIPLSIIIPFPSEPYVITREQYLASYF